MKKKILSTSFGLMLSLAMFLPMSHSLVNVGNPSTTQVNVNSDDCIHIILNGQPVTLCNLSHSQVSWNSGGG